MKLTSLEADQTEDQVALTCLAVDQIEEEFNYLQFMEDGSTLGQFMEYGLTLDEFMEDR